MLGVTRVHHMEKLKLRRGRRWSVIIVPSFRYILDSYPSRQHNRSYITEIQKKCRIVISEPIQLFFFELHKSKYLRRLLPKEQKWQQD